MEDLLVDLHLKSIQLLLQKVEEGTATSGEIGQAVQLLKLNDVTIDITEAEVPEGIKDKLKDSIAGETVIPFAKEA